MWNKWESTCQKKKQMNLKDRSKVDSNEDENFGFVGTLT